MTPRAGIFGAVAFGGALLAPASARALEPGDTDFEVGHQLSVLFDGRVSRNLSYALFHTKPLIARNEETGSTWELRLGARAFYDFAPDTAEVSIRDLAIVRRTEHITATLGFQQIPWGETLGFPVADIVNPRDGRDPLFIDADWVRLPLFAANVQYTGGHFRAQAILTPIPRSPELPEAGSPFLPSSVPILAAPTFAVTRAGQDAEGGGRVGYIVGGWDLGALFLTHWNRVPVYQTILVNAAPVLAPVNARVNTAGVSLTKPFGEHVVARLDSVLSFGEPQQARDFSAPARVIDSQSVLEGDLVLDGDWLFSLQYEYDRQGSVDRHWASGRAQKAFWNRALELNAFAYRGVNNGDMWIEPSVTWNFLDVFSASARCDLVWGTAGDAGQLGYIDGKHRVFAILRAKL